MMMLTVTLIKVVLAEVATSDSVNDVHKGWRFQIFK
jgi:hypothetical protein